MNEVEKIIRDVVGKNYPSVAYNFLSNNKIVSETPLDKDEDNFDSRLLRDGSGREYFMWGISRWGDGDIISE